MYLGFQGWLFLPIGTRSPFFIKSILKQIFQLTLIYAFRCESVQKENNIEFIYLRLYTTIFHNSE